MPRPAPFVLSVFVLAFFVAAASASAQDTVAIQHDPPPPLPDATFIYARFDTLELKLDFWMPSARRARAEAATGVDSNPARASSMTRDTSRVPFVLWLHGGGWRGGSRTDPCPALPLLDSGFAVASADYRLSTQAPWPAQIHDAAAALRWLRGHADSLNLDTGRAVMWGTSAGGHLAALAGLTTPADGLEGSLGADAEPNGMPAGTPAYSSPGSAPARVRAVVMYHAPTDFLEYHPRRWKRGSSVSQLLRCAPPECPVLARRASPAAYATSDDPPVFLAHGTADSTVPVTQAWRMYAALRAAGIPSELAILPGADHGGPDFVSPDMLARVSAFLARSFAPR